MEFGGVVNKPRLASKAAIAGNGRNA